MSMVVLIIGALCFYIAFQLFFKFLIYLRDRKKGNAESE
jgi:hypothetical protein